MGERTSRAETTQARRHLILQTAITCFIDQGFHKTSIRDIAKRAGVSLGNLYNHFANKEALIEEIAALDAQELQSIEADLQTIAGPAEALDRFVDSYLDHCRQPGSTALTVEIMAEAIRTPHIAERFEQNHRRIIALVARRIDQLRLGADDTPGTESSAAFILDLVESLCMRAAFEQRTPSRKEVADLKAAVKRLL